MDDLLNKIISKLELLLQTKSVLHTPIDGLTLYKKACNDNILMGPDDILISLIFSGKKIIYVGEKRYEYAKGQCLYCGVNAPTLFHGVDESESETLFMATLKLNQEILASTILTLDLKPTKESINAQNKEILVFKAQESLVESFFRLINLLDDKSQMTLIAPLVLEEILNSPVIFRMWGEFVCQSQARPSTKCDYAGYCLYAPKLQAKFKCKFFSL